MTMSNWVGVGSVILAVLSIAYALWEKRSRVSLEAFIRAQNWHLYSKASNANGHTQMALSMFKALDKEMIDLETLEFLSKADAFGQDVFKDTIRQIQFSEPKFDDDTVARWVREGRVAEKHAPLFRQLTPADSVVDSVVIERV